MILPAAVAMLKDSETAIGDQVELSNRVVSWPIAPVFIRRRHSTGARPLTSSERTPPRPLLIVYLKMLHHRQVDTAGPARRRRQRHRSWPMHVAVGGARRRALLTRYGCGRCAGAAYGKSAPNPSGALFVPICRVAFAASRGGRFGPRQLLLLSRRRGAAPRRTPPAPRPERGPSIGARGPRALLLQAAGCCSSEPRRRVIGAAAATVFLFSQPAKL